MPSTHNAILYFIFLALTGYCFRADAQMQFHGTKFFVQKTEVPGTVRLYRLLLKDGTHWYTTSASEVNSMTVSKKFGAVVEPMDAFVYEKQAPGTVRLYRFTIVEEGFPPRYFHTAFAPEMKDNAKLPRFRLHPMRGFVFPHIHQPARDSGLVPLYVFYNPVTRENFYTTSEDEKVQLVRAAEDEKNQKLRELEERFKKLRNRKPTSVALRDASLKVGDIEWKILDARDIGNVLQSDHQLVEPLQSSGRFLWIEVRIENKGTTLRSAIAPVLFDEQGRSFHSSSDAHLHIPRDKNFLILKNVNPGLHFTAAFVYEVPTDAAKLSMLAGDLDLVADDEGAIDLGL